MECARGSKAAVKIGAKIWYSKENGDHWGWHRDVLEEAMEELRSTDPNIADHIDEGLVEVDFGKVHFRADDTVEYESYGADSSRWRKMDYSNVIHGKKHTDCLLWLAEETAPL